jgi:hypothetical protein
MLTVHKSPLTQLKEALGIPADVLLSKLVIEVEGQQFPKVYLVGPVFPIKVKAAAEVVRALGVSVDDRGNVVAEAVMESAAIIVNEPTSDALSDVVADFLDKLKEGDDHAAR